MTKIVNCIKLSSLKGYTEPVDDMKDNKSAETVFVSLFGVIRPTGEFFYSFRYVSITGEGLHILT